MLTVLQLTVNILYHVDNDKSATSDIMLTCVLFTIGNILDMTGDVKDWRVYTDSFIHLCYMLWTFQKLELASNKIRSMNGLQGHKYLEMINLEENEARFIHICTHTKWGAICIFMILLVNVD